MYIKICFVFKFDLFYFYTHISSPNALGMKFSDTNKDSFVIKRRLKIIFRFKNKKTTKNN